MNSEESPGKAKPFRKAGRQSRHLNQQSLLIWTALDKPSPCTEMVIEGLRKWLAS